MTFDIGAFNANGTMDFNGHTLNFIGNSYSSGGSAVGTGTLRLAPTLGTVVVGGNAPGVTLASGLANYSAGGTFSGPLTVNPGATFRLNAAAVNIYGDATINGVITKESVFGGNIINFFGGTFTNNGGVTADAVRFNPSGSIPLAQSIAGVGVWSGGWIAMGNNLPATPSTVKLLNDVSFAVDEWQIGYTLDLNGHILTSTGSGNQFGILLSNSGLVAGPGTFVMQPLSGTPLIRSLNLGATFGAELKIAGGSVRTDTTFAPFVVTGPLTVDSGAVFRLNGTGADVRGNVTINGTLDMLNSFAALTFRGTSFTNNGLINGANVYFWPLAAQQMNLAGSGTWAGAGSIYFDPLSSTSVLTDVTYGSGTLQTYGAFQTVGPSVFSVPCSVSWTGPGEVTGNIKRTNLASCPGTAVSYGNPFTTILFNSGTPPTEVLVKIEPATVPAGFPNAVSRLYTITPVGGSGYSATLRLHYLESELNGNSESDLNLWRFDGSIWTIQGTTNRNAVDNWVEYSGVTQFSPWAISGPNAPTAAVVGISGRVRRADGSGISNATLTLSSVDGATRLVRTSNLGYFSFDEVPSGATYVVSVAAKQYRFRQPSMIVGVQDDIADLDFVADPAP